MANDALTLQDVDAFYGDSHILHNVGLRVRTGSLLALLGRNGVGKTTCMNTIVGFLRPQNGVIRLFGDIISGLTPEAISRKGIGLVPQGRRIFQTLTVRENLLVARHGKGTWTPDWVFQTFPRLAERRDQIAGSLSGGEQQMLAIGRGLMGSPRVLLLDEPSEGLAPQIVADVGRVIADLKATGLSIILVEQNMRLALSLADDVVIINAGQVAFSGTADEIRDDSTKLERYLGVY